MYKNQEEFEKSQLSKKRELSQDTIESVMQNSDANVFSTDVQGSFNNVPNNYDENMQEATKSIYHDEIANNPNYNNENSSMNYSNRSTEQRDDYQERADIKEIVAVHKEEGNISAVKLNDGSILSKEEAISLVKEGGIKDMNVGRRGSRETLRKNPVEDASKCLANMPRF